MPLNRGKNWTLIVPYTTRILVVKCYKGFLLIKIEFSWQFVTFLVQDCRVLHFLGMMHVHHRFYIINFKGVAKMYFFSLSLSKAPDICIRDKIYEFEFACTFSEPFNLCFNELKLKFVFHIKYQMWIKHTCLVHLSMVQLITVLLCTVLQCTMQLWIVQ